MGQLNIQQPIVQIRGLRSFAIEQEFLFRLLTQQSIFYAELIVRKLELLNVGKLKGLEFVAQFLLDIVPEYDPMPVKKFCQGLGNAVAHGSIPSSRAAMSSGGGNWPFSSFGRVLVIS
ncbi:MAG: hypothetical protein FD137_1818 [Spirochaetes bacterium]|nr:MAG: hypothetical protein FD137_1818 [Spirochaetota bacterium]